MVENTLDHGSISWHMHTHLLTNTRSNTQREHGALNTPRAKTHIKTLQRINTSPIAFSL